MIDTDMAFDNRDVPALASLANDVAGSFGHFSAQDVIPILGGPHKMVLNVIACVRTVAILRQDYPRSVFLGG